MARAISYVRFSTPKQALGDSLRRQLERTREYCAKHGLTLDETMRDDGLSGFKGDHVKHGALGVFLDKVKAGEVERGTYLIIEHMDRLSRQNTRIALTLLLNVINAGIRVVTLFNEQVYSDASETIEHDLIGAILYMSEAHKASVRKADLLKHTWDGHRQAVASGQRKKLTSTRPAWLDVSADGGFVANRQGAKTVRRIYELSASGMSAHAICKLLNDPKQPVPTLTGIRTNKITGKSVANGWNAARIAEIIKSDAVLGWFQPCVRDGNKRVPIGEPIKDYYPAVVKQELADRARYHLSSRRFGGVGSGRTGPGVTNLFTGLARCGVCGSLMYLYNHGKVAGRRGVHSGHLRCSHNKRGHCDNAGKIAYAAFERFVVRLIGGFAVPDDTVGGPDPVMQELLERLAEAKADASKTQESVNALLDAFVGKASPLVMARIDQLEAQHVTLTERVADLEKQIETQRGKSQPNEAMEAVQRVLHDVASTDPDKRLLARTRVAAGMKQFIHHFLCFPNRGIIAEYGIGSRDSVLCIIRCRRKPDGEFEVWHTDWDFGLRKGKPAYTFVDGQLVRTEIDPAVREAALAALG